MLIPELIDSQRFIRAGQSLPENYPHLLYVSRSCREMAPPAALSNLRVRFHPINFFLRILSLFFFSALRYLGSLCFPF